MPEPRLRVVQVPPEHRLRPGMKLEVVGSARDGVLIARDSSYRLYVLSPLSAVPS